MLLLHTELSLKEMFVYIFIERGSGGSSNEDTVIEKSQAYSETWCSDFRYFKDPILMLRIVVGAILKNPSKVCQISMVCCVLHSLSLRTGWQF